MERSLLEQRLSDIDYNIAYIRDKIAEAALKSGRSENDVTLMAVTKTVEPVFINRAIEQGIRLIGENKVQELLGKKEYLSLDECKAHLIGHLQTNKVKQIVGQVDMIQSVDSIRLANEISKRSIEKGITTKCLIEVNIGNEESKTGVPFEQAYELIDEISALKGINIEGLMTIPPICDNNLQLDKYFSKMHGLFIDIADKKLDNVNMNILSMGMSSDYERAILNGSSLVRVGTALFGQRIY